MRVARRCHRRRPFEIPRSWEGDLADGTDAKQDERSPEHPPPANRSPIPDWALAVDKVFSIAAFALFAWMLIGVIRFGPWAMKKPVT